MAGNADSQSRLGRKRQGQPLSEINVTPMVDVMLVLVIIFIVTGQVMTSGNEVDLPDADAKQISSTAEPIEVTVDALGNIFLGATLIESDEFGDVMTQLALSSADVGEQRVFVRADQSLAYGKVMEVVARISGAGFAKVAFISKPASSRPDADLP